MKFKNLLPFFVALGLVWPFMDYLVIVEMFYLLVPFGIIISASLIYLISSLFIKRLNSRKAIVLSSIIPVFVLAQLFSCFAVNKIQSIRSGYIIEEIEDIKNQTGNYPTEYKTKLGIEYVKNKEEDRYRIIYSRGFMVREMYFSNTHKWQSRGWND